MTDPSPSDPSLLKDVDNVDENATAAPDGDEIPVSSPARRIRDLAYGGYDKDYDGPDPASLGFTGPAHLNNFRPFQHYYSIMVAPKGNKLGVK